MPRTRGRTWQHGVGRWKLVQYGNARTQRTLSTTAVPEVNVAWKQLGARSIHPLKEFPQITPLTHFP